jgi:hypothetical protein
VDATIRQLLSQVGQVRIRAALWRLGFQRLPERLANASTDAMVRWRGAMGMDLVNAKNNPA